MVSFLDNVDGRMLDIKVLASSIPFPTPSDAMFASFVLKYSNMTIELFDDLFALFNHPEFRSESLQIKRKEDILGHIAEQRRSIAKDRMAKRNETTVHRQLHHGNRNGVPLLAVELVAEVVEFGRTPFHRVLLQTARECDAGRLLRTMCLVHRSWTDIAQRCLRRRIFASGWTGIPFLLASPHLGPWVRDLSIRSLIVSPNLEDCQLGTSYSDTPRLINEILQKCPNVTNLHLQDFQPRSELMPALGPPHDIIQKLGDLVYLENLWLHQRFEPAGKDLPDLRILISRLHLLKSVSLRKWSPRKTEKAEAGLQHSLLSVASTNSLRRLEFMSLVDIRVSDEGPLYQLLHSFHENAPKTLELSLADLRASILYGPEGRSRDPRSFVRPIQPHVTKLMLVEYKQDNITSFIQQFPSLQSLCLCISVSFDEVRLLKLPQSVRSVHIHFGAVPGEAQESFMMAILTSSPHVRRLLITYKVKGHHDDLYGPLFTATNTHCRNNNVVFELREIDGAPSVLDM